MGFVILVSFVNQLFSVRQPSIRLQAPVIQLLSYPVGKAAERWLPDARIFGHSLNPGVFNKKEHMLISIMAAVGTGLPHSRYISESLLSTNQPSNMFLFERLVAKCLCDATCNSLHAMAGQVPGPIVCRQLLVPDSPCARHEPDGLWSGGLVPAVFGLPLVLHLAKVACDDCAKQSTSLW